MNNRAQVHNSTPKPRIEERDADVCVAAIYQFADLGVCRADLPKLREHIFDELDARGILGTMILAREGLNGTIAGDPDAIDAFVHFLRSDDLFEGHFNAMEVKISTCPTPPFGRTRVKLKEEIVTMRVPGVSPSEVVGTYVEPEDWNELIDDPDTVLIDTRNDFEVQVGTFRAADGRPAINPQTTAFSDFPAYVQANRDKLEGRKVAMFCTGGIRCEKATSYLMSLGIQDVFHLKGGILRYLERVPQSESRWVGECFVFDDRVTVDHDLKPGAYTLCHACRLPVAPSDTGRPEFEPGVSCHHCFGTHDQSTIQGLRERQRQIQLARSRGERHLGAIRLGDD